MHPYRIVQEALNNATKHGKAQHVTITIAANVENLDLTIADDGSGLRSPPAGPRGMGMHTMRYRARMLGGDLSIDPAAGGGTTVRCSVPWKRISAPVLA